MGNPLAHHQSVPKKYDKNFQYHVYQLGKAYNSDDLYISHSDFRDQSFDDVEEVFFENAALVL